MLVENAFIMLEFLGVPVNSAVDLQECLAARGRLADWLDISRTPLEPALKLTNYIVINMKNKVLFSNTIYFWFFDNKKERVSENVVKIK